MSEPEEMVVKKKRRSGGGGDQSSAYSGPGQIEVRERANVGNHSSLFISLLSLILIVLTLIRLSIFLIFLGNLHRGASLKQS